MPDLPSSEAAPPALDLAGQMAGEYRLRRKLGQGGFGVVYEAEHPVLKRRAAVKVLHQPARADSDAVLRFISEAQAANQIRSRHIVDIFSFGTLADGRPFYVMDLLDGEPLDRHLERERRLDVATTLQLLTPIVEALDAAHAAGIVHRDLKPQNIFLVWEGGETVPKLLDFGTAKLLAASAVQTVTGTPVGTPLYMSPEQARGEKVDARADVYALGVLFHELLTGELPISAPSTIAVLMAQLTVKPAPVSSVAADLPASLDAPILRMLEKDPAARPATAGAALAEVRQAAAAAGIAVPAGLPRLRRPPAPPVPARGDQPTVRAESPLISPPVSPPAVRPRGRAPLVLAAVGVLVGVGVVGAHLLGQRRVPTPMPAAAPVAAPVPAPPTPVRAPPDSVELVLYGAPRGARVFHDDRPIGAAPGPLRLPFGEQPIELTITAPGHEDKRMLVIPNQPLRATVALTRKAPVRPRVKKIPTDLESPF